MDYHATGRSRLLRALALVPSLLRHLASHRPQQQNTDILYIKHRRWCITQIHNEVFSHTQITLLRMLIILQLVSYLQCNFMFLYEGHLESKERFAIQRYLLIIGKKQNMQVL